MSMNDPLSTAMSKILNRENRGKESCLVKPCSKQIKAVLKIMKDHLYLGGCEEVKTHRGDYLNIILIGAINKCGVIKPRYAVKKDGFEKFEKRYLPAKGFGIIVVSTTKGMMSHEDAKKKGLGGKLIAYCY